uniref:WGS project CBMG000000000 data, contig CS5907-c002301 n=1 Tax=Fusarium acuminatum CS5907 TaxID=1318461 RepID=A0A090MFT5_9HYPO|nr:unnamed protein product [Fusarium acuminatum CS5907]
MDKHNILLGEIAEPEDCVPGGTAEESNDDGIRSFAGTDFVDELYTDDSDLNEHGVSITAIEAQATKQNNFKINHSKGSFRMKRQYARFIIPIDSSVLTTTVQPRTSYYKQARPILMQRKRSKCSNEDTP